mgnify:CR=1 FL=1
MWFMEFLDKFFLFLSSKQYKRTVLKLKYLNILVARINEFHKLKFIYPGKVKFFCKISTVDFSFIVPFRPTMEISQNFAAFSEYINFKGAPLILSKYIHVSIYYVSTMWPFTTQERVTL